MMLCIKAMLRGWGWRAKLQLSFHLGRRVDKRRSIR